MSYEISGRVSVVTFQLHVDGQTWRTHLRSFRDQVAASGATLVPVIKGNGYGFGLQTLIWEVAALELDVVAVGNVWEAREVLSHHEHGFVGDVVVLNPWDPRDVAAQQVWDDIDQWDNSHRVIRTVSSPESLAQVGKHRYLIEQLTTMSRFGLHSPAAPGNSEGLSVHLPMVGSHVPDVGQQWPSVWVSHLTTQELSAMKAHHPRMFLRAGTQLWLGARNALKARGTVLEVHRDVHTSVGYHQRAVPKGSAVVIVGGGTAHGVSLTAPSNARTLRSRIVSVARGVLDAAGRALSPFSFNGKQLWFAEPPHMHVSMLVVPRGARVPTVGDQLECDVRMTTAKFDQIVGI